MYNEPPIVRPPVIEENPFSSPVVINTGKHVKKKSNDSWAWKTVVVTLLLSPVIWYLSSYCLMEYRIKDASRQIVSTFDVHPKNSKEYRDGVAAANQLMRMTFEHGETESQEIAVDSLGYTILLEMLICIPLGIFWVIRR